MHVCIYPYENNQETVEIFKELYKYINPGCFTHFTLIMTCTLFLSLFFLNDMHINTVQIDNNRGVNFVIIQYNLLFG
jgi:hypothetical protein